MSFERLVGQQRAAGDLTKALESGRVPHALIFAGPEGVGKALCALEFAAALLCPDAKPLACGKCPSCRRVNALTHSDLNRLSLLEGKSEISVDQIRDLSERLAESPMEGKRKVAIIDPADRMSVQGQNAFLKTLEEPPADTVIILVAESIDALLATVRSRCTRVTFVRLSDEAVEAFLRTRGASAESAAALGRLAQGSFGEAARLLEGSFAEDRVPIIQAILAVAPGGEEQIAEVIACGGAAKGKKALKERREDVLTLLSALHSALVDAMRVKAGVPIRVNADLAASITAFAGEEDMAAIAALEKEVSDAIIVVSTYADSRLVALRLAAAFARRPNPSDSGRG